MSSDGKRPRPPTDDDELAGLRSKLEQLGAQAASLREANQAQRTRIETLQGQLNDIVHSNGWRLLQRMYGLRFAIAPKGSVRERAAKRLLKAQRVARERLAASPLSAVMRLVGQGPELRNLKAKEYIGFAAAGGITCPDLAPGLVSVILPVYNQASMLGESIRSVLAQTYANLELVVLSDGSTDGVEEVFAQFAGEPRVRFLRQANQRLPRALSNGFELARGEFWTWTSADNLMEPRQLERQVAFLREHSDVGMVYCDYLAIDDRGEPLADPRWRSQNRRSEHDPEVHLPRDPTPINTVQDNFIGPCFMYRGWIGRALGDYTPSNGVEDYDYWMRMNDLVRVSHLGTDEVLYRYRVHDNTLNARSEQHDIKGRVGQLMRYEVDRSWYYDEPWRLCVDEATRKLFGAKVPRGVTVERIEDVRDLANQPQKRLIVVTPASLAATAARPRSPDSCLVAWFDGADTSPIELRRELEQHVDLCVAFDRPVAERLALFSRDVYLAHEPLELLSVAMAHANNRLFAAKTIPLEDFERRLPEGLDPSGQPLRVVLQVDNFLQGGLEHVVLDVADVLRERGAQVSLLVLGEEGPAMEKVRDRGLKVERLPKEGRPAAYRELLERERFHVVNAHYSLFGAAVAHDVGVPFVQTMHNSYVWIWDNHVAEWREADRYTTGYLCVSSTVAAFADLCLGLPCSKMIIAPNGIDTASLDAARARSDRAGVRAELGLEPDDFVFLCTATITEVKSQLWLVKALGEAVKQDPRIKVALLGRVGTDPWSEDYAKRMKAEIEKLGLGEHVLELGYHKDPQRFYFAADAFALPSFVEGWSLALAEAAYAGLPLLATDTGAAVEVLGELGGELVAAPGERPYATYGDRFYKNLRTDQAAFVGKLAEAMVTIAKSPRPPALTPTRRAELDKRHAYALYEKAFTWLAGGGDFAQARRWSPSHGPRLTAHSRAEHSRLQASRVRRARGFTPKEHKLEQLVARAASSRGVVVFPRSITWSNWLFQRPHHLARAFAERGYTVVFDDGLRFTGFVGFREVEPDLHLYRGPAETLRKLPSPLVWSFAYNFDQALGFGPGARVVYDLVDELEVHPHDQEQLKEQHRAALTEAELVVYVARHLERLLKARPDALYLPNGVDVDHFADPSVSRGRDAAFERILALGKPIVGYYGALAEWFDYALLEEAARRRRDLEFVLIGPAYDRSLERTSALDQPNVSWLGPRDYATLPAYLSEFAVATIPFKLNEITRSTSPLKLYEYFAGGKPVVTTAMPECMGFDEVLVARDAGEFVAHLDRALAKGRQPAFVEQLRALARKHAWAERVAAVEQTLQKTRGRDGRSSPGRSAVQR